MSSIVVDRLNVVLVSRSGLGGKSETMIEAIVGNLAGRPGIDLVLVSPLAEIDNETTDQLTLLSIGAGAAVLTWTSPEQTMVDLRSIGFDGVRTPHASDPLPHSAKAAGRKIFAIDLRDIATVDELIDQLDRLRTVQSVKTFSLGGPRQPSIQPEKQLPPKTLKLKAIDKPAEEPRPMPQHYASRSSQDNQSQLSIGDAGLDDLIDQLDDFDV